MNSINKRCRLLNNSPELALHQPQDIARAPNEEELHEGIIEGDPFTHEEVEIARDEYADVESLGLE